MAPASSLAAPEPLLVGEPISEQLFTATEIPKLLPERPKLSPPVIVQPDGQIIYPVHPKQGIALESIADEVFFGGAAGGGKSHLLRVAAIRWCMAIPGLQTYLFRRLASDLRPNHIEGPAGFKVLLAPLINRGLARIIQGEIQFFNGARIYLRHFKDEQALTKYRGLEIHLLLIDELTHFLETMFLELRARCRVPENLPIPDAWRSQFPKIMCCGNPGGVGHDWVKRTFVEPAKPFQVWQAPEADGGARRVFIPSRVDDNPSLAIADPRYKAKLMGLRDPALVRALLEGDWNVVAGSMFGDAWRAISNQGREWHVCRGFPIPYGWDIWRSADDGYANPFACYWFTQDPDTDTIYVVDEIYGPGILPEMASEEIKKRDRELVIRLPNGQLARHDAILQGLIDPSAFSDVGMQERAGQKALSRGAAMNALGCRWSPAEKGPGSRADRAQKLHQLLAANPADPRRPGIVFFARCVNAIRTIPAIMRDKIKPECVSKDAEDHAFDGVTYGLQWKRTKSRTVPLSGI